MTFSHLNLQRIPERIPEIETVMTEYWRMIGMYGNRRPEELRVRPMLPIYSPIGTDPCNKVARTWSVLALGEFCDMVTGDRFEMFRVQRGTERYYTDATGEQLFRNEV